MTRSAVPGLLSVAILALSLELVRADPAAPVTRWPAQPGAKVSPFDGSRFVPLAPAPDVGNRAFTVSVWVHAADLARGNATYGRGIARSTHGEQVGDWLLSVHPDGRVRFINWRQPGDDKTGSHISREAVIKTGAWYHIVAGWDGTANRIFVNGAEQPFDDGATATNWQTGDEVGRSWTQPDYYWTGAIDDLQVHRRTLSAAEIQQAFKAGAATRVRSLETASANEAAPVTRWPATPGSASNTFDGIRYVDLHPVPDVGSGAFTVSVWANANDLARGNANYGRGIARSTRGEQVGDWLLSVHPDGRVRFIHWRTAGEDKTGSHVTRAPVVKPGEWFHVAASWDGKAHYIIVNGKAVEFDDGTSATGWETGHELGRCWTNADYHWDGMIDNMQVYRRALAAAEIQAALATRPSARTPVTTPAVPADPSAPILRWPAKPSAEKATFDGGQFFPFQPPPLVGDGAFSVSVWIYASDLQGGNATYGRGIARSTRREQVGDWMLSVHPDGRLRFTNWRRSGADPSGSHITRNALIQPEAWHHVATVWDGKTNHIFVNGKEVAFTDGPSAAGWETGHEVGRGWTQADYFWDGMIDDLLVYRRALTAAEVESACKTNPPTQRPATLRPAGDAAVSTAIDREITARLQQQGVTAAPTADDGEFLRRATLDLLGRIPTPAETEAFLSDTAADKRHRLVDTLLADRELPLYWSQVLSGWLMPRESRRDPMFVGYLRHSLAKNRAWDSLAREMIVARPRGPGDLSANAFLVARKEALKDRSIAREVGRAFFGVDLRCAQCHDHPSVEEWTHERYLGLAAFFARSYEVPATNAQNQKVVAIAEKASGDLEYTASDGKKRIAPLMFLDGTLVSETPTDASSGEQVAAIAGLPPPPPFSRREALARVALDPRKPYFKRAMVNRVWRQLMGRGLVEPVDNMHDGNAATHPRLLDLLADDFAAHGFDLRRLISVIMQSQAYARSSRWPGSGPVPDETLYAVAVLKPLDADQLALSLPLATGHYDDGLRAKRPLAQLRTAGASREIIAEFDARTDEFEPTATQALFLLNSSYVRTNLTAKSPRAQALSSIADDNTLAERAYLSILCRLPTAEEKAVVSRYLQDGGAKSRLEACRELVWALVSSAEFRFNH